MKYMTMFGKAFIGYFMAFMLMILFLSLLVAFEDSEPESDQYGFILETKKFMGDVNEVIRKGYLVQEHKQTRTICAERFIATLPVESYCKQKNMDIGIAENWPEEEAEIHKKMRQEVDSLLTIRFEYYGD